MLPDHLNPTSAINTERSVFFEVDDSVLRAENAQMVRWRCCAPNPA